MKLDLIVLPYESAERLMYLIGDAADMVGFRLPREDAEELVRVAEQVIEGAKRKLALLAKQVCPYCAQPTIWIEWGFDCGGIGYSEIDCLKCDKCESLIHHDGSKLCDARELK